MKPMFSVILAGTTLLVAAACAEEQHFPFNMPREKPDMPLSAAMERAYDAYSAPTYWWNELFSKFRFTELEGLDYHGGDGTISRRDPSKVVKANGKYYVWYTCRRTRTPPRGAEGGSDVIPSADWDLAEIWYATSEDGFTWKEQGVAVPRPPKPKVGWRSVSTPDVLVWKGKYYLYYQGFMEMSGKRGDDCPVTVSWADSPDGPWTPCNEVVIPNGSEGAWDQFSIHDPYPLVYKGRIYLYYKSDFNGHYEMIRATGLAVADDPMGPFEKCPLNPVLNSSHETGLFPFKGGIAAMSSRHGNELSTMQWSPDGINFQVASHITLIPLAPGPYVPDAFTGTDDGRGITWGLCHFTDIGPRDKRYSVIARFDCDLSLDKDDHWMKDPEHYWPPEFYYYTGLGADAKEQLKQEARQDLKKR